MAASDFMIKAHPKHSSKSATKFAVFKERSHFLKNKRAASNTFGTVVTKISSAQELLSCSAKKKFFIKKIIFKFNFPPYVNSIHESSLFGRIHFLRETIKINFLS